jgi:hypothetical protein
MNFIFKMELFPFFILATGVPAEGVKLCQLFENQCAVRRSTRLFRKWTTLKQILIASQNIQDSTLFAWINGYWKLRISSIASSMAKDDTMQLKTSECK